MGRLANEEATALRALINRLPPVVDPRAAADERALRLIVRYNLRHQMTLSAALKLVAAETLHSPFSEIETTARALHAMLLKQHH